MKTRSMGWSVCGEECDCFRVSRKVGGLDHMMEKCVSASLFLSSGEIHRWGKGESKWKETGMGFWEFFFFAGFGLQNTAKLSRTRCTDLKRRGDKCVEV